ncbi:hypothetical protein [Streptomyces kebangsaanensis]|uniref:hypothetical protein n=1 Tax=Streptomyces kebangsaanensis TaxID=864058 RepID=UPI00093F0F3B|nr:hypothetical protein [Streptomyces kebangsaanensis]
MTALDLRREITARGFRGHCSTVRDRIRRDPPRQKGFTPAPPPPSVRQVTGWLTRHPATLTEEEKPNRKAVLDRCPESASAAEPTSSFAEMLTTDRHPGPAGGAVDRIKMLERRLFGRARFPLLRKRVLLA